MNGRGGRSGPQRGSGLSVRNVSVRYGSTLALDSFSLDVDTGEVVAVIGPSGSGKSTLLRAIAGLERLDGGSISAGGRSLDGVPTHERDLGLMFQDHALFPHLSVGDNIGFGLRMKGWSKPRRDARVAELLSLVGLESFGSRAVDQLSGGEAQRVALARALAPEPALLMLDEPFGSLDRVLRDQLTVELRRLLRELGQTALHVTHDQAEAFTVADRVAVLRAGRLEQLGEPAELWRAPRSPFVAEFLGHPNLVTVEVEPGGGVVLGGHRVGSVPESDLGAGRHRVVVPASALWVDDQGPLPAEVVSTVFREGRFRAVVRAVGGDGAPGDEGAGDEVAGDGAVEGLELVLDTPRSLAVGERVHLAVAVGAVHPIDDRSGPPDSTLEVTVR